MKRNILLIVFDFPPCISPGVERTLRFAEHLAAQGWNPVILTVNKNTFNNPAVNAFDDDRYPFPVYRTFCLDVSKHLSFRGKYFGWMKQPDRYCGWFFTAIREGWRIVKRHDIDVIWSTYPLLTSHLIGLALSRLTKLPWIADYRDPLQCHYDISVYPAFKFHRWIDKQTIKSCTKAVFTSPGAASLYKNLYPEIDHSKFSVIENGFETSLIDQAKHINNYGPVSNKHTMVHLGSLYENGRNPKVLFESLAQLKQQKLVDSMSFELRLVGSNNQNLYEKYTTSLGIEDLVSFVPQIPYKESLSLLLSADSLLVVQGEIFSYQIPSKAYEYLSSNAPILVVSNKASDTSALFNGFEGCHIAENTDDICNSILKIIANEIAFKRDGDSFSRLNRSKKLVSLLADI